MFELPKPSVQMDFDGERFVSGLRGEIAYEHYLRYLFAEQFCAGKAVLDVASGEGYGSSLLARTASAVVGVDLSEDAVAFARSNYTAPNLRFERGDVREMPLEDDAFDVVVSFETLEHLAEHEAFLKEIKRVLRPGGILILSSPDRDVYLSGLPANPFHARELNRTELNDLVARYFAHHSFGGERFLAGAMLLPLDDILDGDIRSFAFKEGGAVRAQKGVEGWTYIIAVASDEPLPPVTWAVLTDDLFVPSLRNEASERLQALMRENETLRAERTRLEAENTELRNHIDRLKFEIPAALKDQRNRLLKDVLKILS